MLENREEKVEDVHSNHEEEVKGETAQDVKDSEALSSEKDEGKIDVEDANKKALDEVENKIAEDAEKDDERNNIPYKEYQQLDLESLVDELEDLIKKNPVQQINKHVNEIKSVFNKKFGALLAEKKEAFLAEGGDSIDFQFSSPVKTKYNTLLGDYKKKRDQYYGELEKTFSENLERRLKVIEDLKQIIEEADANTMYKSFKELQNTWRSIGSIPKSRYNDTWRTYHHHVERFYDLLHLSNDFRELDFKNNLEEKLQLIKRAEELAELDDVNEAFKELQKLHKAWKEDVGPVALEMREEIWQKFSDATKKVHDKRHEHYKQMKSQYQDIIDEKLKVIEKIENYDFSNNNSHADWQNSIKEIEALRELYFKAGKLPYSKSEPVWQKLKAATREFNKAKNEFYKKEKSDQQENLEKKQELVNVAVLLKDSEDWENTANNLKRVQAEWKRIGHVPKKFSDKIWKEFKTACNHFFNRYHQQKNSISKEQQETINDRKEFLDKIFAIKKATKEEIVDLINQWSDFGKLPRSARNLDVKFNKVIDDLLEKLPIDKSELAMIKFVNIVDGYVKNENYKRLDSEGHFVRKKVDEISKEIQQLENNLGFFTNDSEDSPMFDNVRDKIEGFKDDLEIWNKKLEYLKGLKY